MNENFFINEPINFNNICKIYPPKVKDMIHEENMGEWINLLTFSHEDLEDLLSEKGLELTEDMSLLTFLIQSGLNSQSVAKRIEEAFMFFTHEKISIIEDSNIIILGDINEDKIRAIDDSNYFDFQNLIRESIGASPKKPYDFSASSKRREFAARARKRDRIKNQQEDRPTLTTLLASICCMGMGINPLNIGEITYASIQTLLHIYQQKERYDTDIRSLLAGADPKHVKPKYWIRNLEEEN